MLDRVRTQLYQLLPTTDTTEVSSYQDLVQYSFKVFRNKILHHKRKLTDDTTQYNSYRNFSSCLEIGDMFFVIQCSINESCF
jgi:hypothetical protein